MIEKWLWEKVWRKVLRIIVEIVIRVCWEVFGEELVIFVVTFGDFPTISEVIVIVNKTSYWWKFDDCYCCACWRNLLLYLPSLLYLGLVVCLSCLEFVDNICLCKLAINSLKTLMETRSKAQRDAELADAKGSGFITGEGETHPTRDPSPPILTPVGARATPVLMEESSCDAEQPQGHAGLQHRLEISTLNQICT